MEALFNLPMIWALDNSAATDPKSDISGLAALQH
jgi:hypothetical protein